MNSEWMTLSAEDKLPPVADNEAHEVRQMPDGSLQFRVVDTDDPVRKAKFEAAVRDSMERYAGAFKKLAELGD